MVGLEAVRYSLVGDNNLIGLPLLCLTKQQRGTARVSTLL